MVRGDSVFVMEGLCGQPGLKARLLHPALWECVLLVHAGFGPERITRKDELNHCLDLALGFLILNHLIFHFITDLGQFLFLLLLMRFDQPDRAFAAVLLWSISLLFLLLWLNKG